MFTDIPIISHTNHTTNKNLLIILTVSPHLKPFYMWPYIIRWMFMSVMVVDLNFDGVIIKIFVYMLMYLVFLHPSYVKKKSICKNYIRQVPMVKNVHSCFLQFFHMYILIDIHVFWYTCSLPNPSPGKFSKILILTLQLKLIFLVIF